MNFPSNTRIGALGEMDIGRLFVSWSWNVGTDRIDTGYDLYVAPDFEKYSGARFLIQAKGTAKASANGRVVARVSKARLREYAVNVHPVFVVRATSDGRLFWIHAQQWASENPGVLNGQGAGQIRFQAENDLHDRARFEKYLEKVLIGRPGTHVRSESGDFRALSSIDPHVGVNVSQGALGFRHDVYARAEPVAATFSFKANGSDENVRRASEAIGYGLPRTFDVEDVTVVGSPAFSEFVGKDLSTAKISIEQTPSGFSTIRLYPGSKFSINSPGLSIRARMFRGALGLAVSTDGMDSIFEIKLLLPPPDGAQKPEFTFGIKRAAIEGKVIRELDELASVANWVEKVNLERALYLEASYKEKTGRLNPDKDAFLTYKPLLTWMLLIGRLHLVAKAINSDFSLPVDPVFSQQDIADVELAYLLLKGDVTRINLKNVSFVPESGGFISSGKNDAILKTSLTFTLLGQNLGSIPVEIRLKGFIFQVDASTGNVSMNKMDDGIAEISHAILL